MRQRRTLYANDARHFYLFVFEPPMNLRDAWRPVDDVAGTNVDTFVYMVERGDGLFYPSKVGQRFGSDIQPFDSTAYWRVWENMQSLIDRGLDPLTVLIDRAHEKGMDFIASVRMTSYLGIDPAHKVPEGRGFAHPEVRDHQGAVLKELATEYPTDGIELDFAAPPGGGPFPLRPEDVPEYTPVITEWVRSISETVHNRPGKPGIVGARVYPTEEMCLNNGFDVRTWLKQGLVDYIVPMVYVYFNLDPDMPIDWAVEAAHEADASVYGMLQPYVRDEATGSPVRINPTAEQMRAVTANYWDRGADGMYGFFMQWPLGDTERRILSELGDPDLISESDKHYVLHERSDAAADIGYDAVLPLRIPSADPGKRYAIPFRIADDIEGAGERVRRVTLKLSVDNLLSADQLTILLNGQSLECETCLRDYARGVAVYAGQQLELHLTRVRPRKGDNLLEVSLDKRPDNMVGGVVIHDVEVIVEYGSYPSRL